MTDVLSSYESLACKAHRYLILYKSVIFSGLRSENSLFVEHSPTLSAVWRSLWSFKWPLKVMQLHNLTFFWDCLRVISDSVAVLSLWFGVKVCFSSQNKWVCQPAGRNIHHSFLPCTARCLKSRESSVEQFLKSQVSVCSFFLSDHDLAAWFISTDRASIYSLPFSVVKSHKYEIQTWIMKSVLILSRYQKNPKIVFLSQRMRTVAPRSLSRINCAVALVWSKLGELHCSSQS